MKLWVISPYVFIGSIIALGLSYPLIVSQDFFQFNNSEIYLPNNFETLELSADANGLEYQATTTLYISGDVMLARHVESLMIINGSDYPFKYLDLLKTEPSYFLINFESAVPAVHQKTPNFVMRFSTDGKFLSALRWAGVTHTGLANNHTFDFGQKDFTNTKNVLIKNGLIVFGDPNSINQYSTNVIEIGGKRLGILAINATYANPNQAVLTKTLNELITQSDLQIAYVHWGEEYKNIPTEGQRQLTAQLIDLGIDLIVGHHPHVIQSIETIAGVPVFFSLGNLIFDQYFSTDVQVGLILKLTAKSDALNIQPLVVSSLERKSAPQVLSSPENHQHIARIELFSKINDTPDLFVNGMDIPWPLATLTKKAIMTK